ncbi:MAG TPA: 2-C-methyl-D-erythritol 2,4-cyclodiphosphate synthase, partial [Desulfobacterales bacterium]|nr:2-C-methyl-D-erythritol 2,4-cyclodiphosphate synthase [Desulfobacterales bacterium]
SPAGSKADFSSKALMGPRSDPAAGVRSAPWPWRRCHRREMLSRILQAMVMAAPQALNLKATTTEGCGMIGRGEGIGAMATALIARRPGERDEGP